MNRYPIPVETMNPTQRQRRDYVKVQIVVSSFFGKTIDKFAFEGKPEVVERVVNWRARRWKKP